jgi:hypothetical protein
MDWNVCCLGDHLPIPVKDGTGRVASLFDIRGKGGPIEGNPHFFRDRRKSVLKYFQQNGIFFHDFLPPKN